MDHAQTEDLHPDTVGGEDTRGMQAEGRPRPAYLPGLLPHTSRLLRPWPVLIEAKGIAGHAPGKFFRADTSAGITH